jgi:hypothetical protein
MSLKIGAGEGWLLFDFCCGGREGANPCVMQNTASRIGLRGIIVIDYY